MSSISSFAKNYRQPEGGFLKTRQFDLYVPSFSKEPDEEEKSVIAKYMAKNARECLDLMWNDYSICDEIRAFSEQGLHSKTYNQLIKLFRKSLVKIINIECGKDRSTLFRKSMTGAANIRKVDEWNELFNKVRMLNTGLDFLENNGLTEEDIDYFKSEHFDYMWLKAGKLYREETNHDAEEISDEEYVPLLKAALNPEFAESTAELLKVKLNAFRHREAKLLLGLISEEEIPVLEELSGDAEFMALFSEYSDYIESKKPLDILDDEAMEAVINLTLFEDYADKKSDKKYEPIKLTSELAGAFTDAVFNFSNCCFRLTKACGLRDSYQFDYSEHTYVIDDGGIDLLTSDTLWKIRFNSKQVTTEDTFCVLLQYILLKKTDPAAAAATKYLGIFDAETSEIYLIATDKIDKKTIEDAAKTIDIKFD